MRKMAKNKRVYIRTFGCQMNNRDSEVICGLLKEVGYKIVDQSVEANIVIINTCSVRQHAEDRVWSSIGTFKENQIIGIVGCMAQNYREKIFERAPDVDFVVGPADIQHIPRIIKDILNSKSKAKNSKLLLRKIWETDGVNRPEGVYHTGFYEKKDHAYIVISEGCSNYCSYCVVPFVRGQLHNRLPLDIIKEINIAVDHGIKNITLLGQNVNAYKAKDFNFIKLIKLIDSIKGLKEFSFLTSHPKDTSKDLFNSINELKKLKKWLHLPIQSGSDRILKLMNRGYSVKTYLDLVKDFRKIVKGGLLTTDIIVGFPGETEKDFIETKDLVEKAQFNAAYIFKYSPRINTLAAKMNDNVSKEEKERRHGIILELQRKISKSKGENIK